MSKGQKTALILCGVVALLFAGWYYYAHQLPMQSLEPHSAEQRIISVNGTSIFVDVVSDEPSREQGLGGRSSLAANGGMLFVFDSEGEWGIWMRDMRFSIDVVWLAKDGTVVSLAQDLTPQSYPKVFRPTKPALYVVELPAGFAEEHGITVGSQFQL